MANETSGVFGDLVPFVACFVLLTYGYCAVFPDDRMPPEGHQTYISFTMPTATASGL
jgi:hypothetical protein